MNIPHKHAEVIKAWADDAKIEYRRSYNGTLGNNWSIIINPNWDPNIDYRVKKEREFSKTTIPVYKLAEIFISNVSYKVICSSECCIALFNVANEAIKQHILDTEKG